MSSTTCTTTTSRRTLRTSTRRSLSRRHRNPLGDWHCVSRLGGLSTATGCGTLYQPTIQVGTPCSGSLRCWVACSGRSSCHCDHRHRVPHAPQGLGAAGPIGTRGTSCPPPQGHRGGRSGRTSSATCTATSSSSRPCQDSTTACTCACICACPSPCSTTGLPCSAAASVGWCSSESCRPHQLAGLGSRTPHLHGVVQCVCSC